jgi:CheY-like chemotaxis protein
MSGSRRPDAWPQPEAATLKVLVVDDHEANLNIMVLLLAVFGCRPVLAACGEEAVEHAETQAFDLIVMDLNMPGMDGDEATRLIRESGASKDAFVVRWTTEFFRFAPGLYDTQAPKPMTISALEDLISEALRRIAYRNIRATQAAQSSRDGTPKRP